MNIKKHLLLQTKTFKIWLVWNLNIHTVSNATFKFLHGPVCGILTKVEYLNFQLQERKNKSKPTVDCFYLLVEGMKADRPKSDIQVCTARNFTDDFASWICLYLCLCVPECCCKRFFHAAFPWLNHCLNLASTQNHWHSLANFLFEQFLAAARLKTLRWGFNYF